MMKKFDLIAFIYIISSMLFMGCDQIESPYSVTPPVSGGSNDSVAIRKVLLEDYTGHQCQACPPAHDEATTLKGFFQDSLVIITIHAGYWTSLTPAPFSYDFKTAAGTDLYNTLIPTGTPNPFGNVNRKVFGINRVVEYPNWSSKIGDLLDEAPDAKIKIVPVWNAGTRIISADINSTFLADITGDIGLSVLFTEDSILEWQKFPLPAGNVANYVHRHVLRGSLNGTWGNVIATNPAQNSEFPINLQSNAIAADIKPEHVSVVAILFDNATREVIQVEEKKLLP